MQDEGLLLWDADDRFQFYVLKARFACFDGDRFAIMRLDDESLTPFVVLSSEITHELHELPFDEAKVYFGEIASFIWNFDVVEIDE